jgi:hypothetical protein
MGFMSKHIEVLGAIVFLEVWISRVCNSVGYPEIFGYPESAISG